MRSADAARSNPAFHEVTFRNGTIWDARFAPDGQTIIYGAAWDGAQQEIFSSRFDSTDSRAIGLPNSQILSISSKGEMAVSLHPVNSGPFAQAGTLARVPLAGGAPREVLDNVQWADWTPDGQSLAVIRPGPAEAGNWSFPSGNVIYRPKGWVSHVRFSPGGDLLAIGGSCSRRRRRPGSDHRHPREPPSASSSFYSSVEGLAWAPSGKEVWFSAVPAGSARSIYALDLSGKERLIYRAPGGLTIHDISRTGLVLLTFDKARVSISALPPGETRERSLSWFDWSLLLDMTSDGKTILFSETGEAVGANYSIFVRKTDGSPAVRLGDGGFGALSPDGKWVLAIRGLSGKAGPASHWSRRAQATHRRQDGPLQLCVAAGQQIDHLLRRRIRAPGSLLSARYRGRDSAPTHARRHDCRVAFTGWQVRSGHRCETRALAVPHRRGRTGKAQFRSQSGRAHHGIFRWREKPAGAHR